MSCRGKEKDLGKGGNWKTQYRNPVYYLFKGFATVVIFSKSFHGILELTWFFKLLN